MTDGVGPVSGRSDVCDHIAAFDGFIECAWNDHVLNDCVLEFVLELGELGDPFLSFCLRADGALDGIPSFEERLGGVSGNETAQIN